jgi:hypothetical protein
VLGTFDDRSEDDVGQVVGVDSEWFEGGSGAFGPYEAEKEVAGPDEAVFGSQRRAHRLLQYVAD